MKAYSQAVRQLGEFRVKADLLIFLNELLVCVS